MGHCCDNWCVAVTVRLQRTAASGLAVHNLAMVAAGRGAQVCLLSAGQRPSAGTYQFLGLIFVSNINARLHLCLRFSEFVP